jgi:pSer/pThr/pTyr-binding forkhead associated (FHA) protein
VSSVFSKMNSETTKLIVGSSPDCNIVLNQPTVSKQHCELQWQQNRWHIRDLGSTNGTFVDGIKISQSTPLSSTSDVTLGRGVKLEVPATPQPITKPIDVKQPASATSSSSKFHPKNSQVRNRYRTAIMASIPSVVTLIIVASWIFLRNNDVPVKEKVGQVSEVQTPISESAAARPTSPAINSSTAEIAASTVPTTTPFWAILIEDNLAKSQRLIGTAVAVDTNRLVALASIKEAADELAEEYPNLLIQSNDRIIRLQRNQIAYHPKYPVARQKLTDFETELQTKLDDLKTLDDPTLDESLEWSSRLDSIMSEIAKVELASITCKEKLDSFVAVSGVTSLANDSELALRGYPMLIPSPAVEKNLDVFLIDTSIKTASVAEEASLGRVQLGNTSGVPLVSLICLDQQSKVVGILSRHSQAEDVNAPQVGQITFIEEFWK